jgi:two-component system sensor histidine kinase/response regulator
MTRSEVIDRAALDELLETTGNDPHFLAELIDTYLADSAALLGTMRRALTDAQNDELRRAAHSMKSNSASFGAQALATLCQQLEHQARDGVLEGAAERLERIDAAFVEVERELRALRPAG